MVDSKWLQSRTGPWHKLFTFSQFITICLQIFLRHGVHSIHVVLNLQHNCCLMDTCEFHSLHTWLLFWEIQLYHSLYHSVLSTILLELDNTHIPHKQQIPFLPWVIWPWIDCEQGNWKWRLLRQDQNRNIWPLKSNVVNELVNQEDEKESEESSSTDDSEFSGWDSRIKCFLWFLQIFMLLGLIFPIFYKHTDYFSV